MMAVVPLGSNASHDDVCSTDDRSLLGRLESDCLSARDPNDVSMLTEASILEHRAQWSKRELV